MRNLIVRKALSLGAALAAAGTLVAGPRVTVIGDSISTYNGTSIYPSHYPQGDVNSVDKTWWMIAIKEIGGELACNAAWTASRVAEQDPANYDRAMSSDYRLNKERLGANPDLFLICAGTNDAHYPGTSTGDDVHGVPLGEFQYDNLATADTTKFRPGFARMLDFIRTNYPQADIVVVINTKVDVKSGITDEDWEPYASSMETIGAHYGAICVRVQDVEKYVEPSGLMQVHPNAAGMATMGHQVAAAYVAAKGLEPEAPAEEPTEPVPQSGYTLLEYVGTTAALKDLHIDTGIHPCETTRFKMRFQVPEGASWSGNANMGMIDSPESGVYSRFHFSITQGGRMGAGIRNATSAEFNPASHNDWHDLTMDARMSTVTLNGESKSVGATTGLLDPEHNSTFWLFARNSLTDSLKTKSMWVRISAAELWNGDKQVRNLVPCERNSDHAVGMYDHVKDEFLPFEGADKDSSVEKGPFVSGFVVRPIAPVKYAGSNTMRPRVKVVAPPDNLLTEGTDYELVFDEVTAWGQSSVLVRGLGAFAGNAARVSYWVLPKLPQGCVAVEYIESTGCEYIDLDIQPGKATDFSMKIDVPDSQLDDYPTPFGARNSTQYKMTGSLGKWGLSYGTASYNLGTIYGEHTYEVFPTKGSYAIDGVPGSMTASADLAVPANAFLFAFNDLNGQAGKTANPTHLTKMKVWTFKLWDGGKLKRELVPCKNASNVYGLYDIVSKRFFGNLSGSGAFTGGPELPKLPNAGLAVILY